MTPRGAVVAIDESASREELGRLLDATDEERFPVWGAEEDIVGYVTMRDVARWLGGRVEGPLATLVRPVHVVPESAWALQVLDELQSLRLPIAVVVDEAGGVEGIVDIDDLAEELVGSLKVGAALEASSVEREPGGAVVVPAAMRVHVANRLLGLTLPTSARWSTIGGLLVAELRAMPTIGARVTLADGVELEVVDASTRRVQRVRLCWARPPAEG
jgi:putative hemolysin